jgi:prolyl oligopeptidase
VLRRYTPAKPQGEAIPLPFNGAASVVNDAARAYTDVMYTLSGWTQMPLTYVYNGKDSVDSGLRVNPVLPGLPDLEVVPSHDGAMVPMTLLFKKGLKRDGRNPTLLNAYGAYGFSMTAGFAPARMAWIEQGGVLALANVRGSGVHGDAWHRAGQAGHQGQHLERRHRLRPLADCPGLRIAQDTWRSWAPVPAASSSGARHHGGAAVVCRRGL